TTRPTKFPGRSTGIIEVNVHCRSPLRRVIWRFFFQAEDGIRDRNVTGVQTCALPICVAGLLFSMARPQASIRVPKGQTSVMLAVDVSGSMAASDVQPTRIEAAVAAGRTLIDKLPSNAQV